MFERFVWQASVCVLINFCLSSICEVATLSVDRRSGIGETAKRSEKNLKCQKF